MKERKNEVPGSTITIYRREVAMPATKMLKRGTLVAAGIAALLGAAAPAFAHSSSTPGSNVYTTNSDKTLNVSDTAADSHSAYGEFTRSGVSGISRLDNGGGSGTTLSRNYAETILGVRACVDIQLAPDTCGSWG